MTLTQTAIIVKQLITVSIIVLILGIVSFVGYKIWYAYYLANLPPVEEKPNAQFGLLPQPDFPKVGVSTSNFTYSLDTTTGGLPKTGIDPGFEKIIKVYFIAPTFATFLSPDRSTALAEKFNITTPPQILSETKYQFKDNYRSLLVDLDSGNFFYSNEATVSAKTNLDEDNKLISDFEQFLSSLGVLKENLKNGRNKVVPLKNEGDDLIPSQQRNNAMAALISLWPVSIDNRPVLTGNFDKSTVNAVVFEGADKLDNYLSLNFNYYQIDTSTFATYPLKTSEVAFDDLKNGKGIIIVEPDKPQVSITSVYLGYYLPENYSPYLQPIYVFEGPHFVAYVSAINESFVSSATQN